ncbi:MAG: type IV secretion protein Rhs [Salinicola sp.]|nr:type IV secretion protein Rhs [Salinicola sp.]
MATGPKPISSFFERNRIAQARQRQYKMLQDNEGFNISPTGWDRYPTIGRQGTFISDQKSVAGLIDSSPVNGKIYISKSQALGIEKNMGLEPNSLSGGFKVRKVTGIKEMLPRSPLEGNDYFLGPGNHLPGGHPEMVIKSIPTKDNSSVKTLFEVLIND